MDHTSIKSHNWLWLQLEVSYHQSHRWLFYSGGLERTVCWAAGGFFLAALLPEAAGENWKQGWALFCDPFMIKAEEMMLGSSESHVLQLTLNY